MEPPPDLRFSASVSRLFADLLQEMIETVRRPSDCRIVGLCHFGYLTQQVGKDRIRCD